MPARLPLRRISACKSISRLPTPSPGCFPSFRSAAGLLPRRPSAPLAGGFRSHATAREAAAALIHNGSAEPAGRKVARTGGPDLDRLVGAVRTACGPVMAAPVVTAEAAVGALRACSRAARVLRPLLRQRPVGGTVPPPHEAAERARDTIAAAALDVVTHPPVVLTPDAIAAYVDTQADLGAVAELPDVLALYTTKPRPRRGGGMVVPNPRRAAAAIETATAERALVAAIEARDLDAALGVSKTCFASAAYRRQFLLRYGLGPAAAVVAAPMLAYGIASALGNVQVVVEPATATAVSFFGIMTYLITVTTLGVLARVTADDHMLRVSWCPGTTLLHRWVGEAERASLDRVAAAWGFRDTRRHGEETGPEWETLRQYTLLRHMILDRVEFMEGMQ